MWHVLNRPDQQILSFSDGPGIKRTTSKFELHPEQLINRTIESEVDLGDNFDVKMTTATSKFGTNYLITYLRPKGKSAIYMTAERKILKSKYLKLKSVLRLFH